MNVGLVYSPEDREDQPCIVSGVTEISVDTGYLSGKRSYSRHDDQHEEEAAGKDMHVRH